MEGLIQKIIDAVTTLLEFLKELLLWIPREVAEELLDALASFIEAIPVPQFVQDAQGYINDFIGLTGVSYFIDLLQLDTGFIMILSASLLSFLIRRIPLIG